MIHALTAMGLSPDEQPVGQCSVKALEPYNVLVVPNASALALTPDQVTLITDEVNRGLNIFIDGMSPLALSLGIHASSTTCKVCNIYDVLTLHHLTWSTPAPAPACTFPGSASVLYKDLDSKQTLAAMFDVQRGHCLAFTTLFDPISGLGYSRFPTLPTAFLTAFPVMPAFAQRDIELYYEPAFLSVRNISIEKLVLHWKRWGVRAIHAGCWDFHTKYSYDYARLIKNCHANGIAVYAWFELPYVSEKFYLEHPEWHEKTASGKDANPGWRMPMAMEIPQCRQAVLQFTRDLLNRYDWDGVNLGELYFENTAPPAPRPPDPRDNPETFNPMHPYVRETFKRQYGFEPGAVVLPELRALLEDPSGGLG